MDRATFVFSLPGFVEAHRHSTTMSLRFSLPEDEIPPWEGYSQRQGYPSQGGI